VNTAFYVLHVMLLCMVFTAGGWLAAGDVVNAVVLGLIAAPGLVLSGVMYDRTLIVGYIRRNSRPATRICDLVKVGEPTGLVRADDPSLTFRVAWDGWRLFDPDDRDKSDLFCTWSLLATEGWKKIPLPG
jgi:hypothetical protein